MSETANPESWDNSSSTKTRSWFMVQKSPDSTYRIGFIPTPHGVVGVYTQHGDPFTRLFWGDDGRCFDRNWQRCFTDRRLVTLARRFAAEMARA